MLDAFTLDQIRTFIAAVDEGSFSAAGRRLGRAQSVVSQTLANLEDQLGVRLFDRSGRMPKLTAEGAALIGEARAAVGGVDLLKARAKGLAGGLEPELSVVVDVMFPIGILTAAVVAFREQFPTTPLRLYVEALGAVLQFVLDGRCAFGIVGSLPSEEPQLTRERLVGVRIQMVASPLHPLAAYAGPIPASILAQHVQLVLTDRSTRSQGREFGVFSPKTWRLADLGAKHAFLRAGLGWGGMPMNVVAADIEAGLLAPLVMEDADPAGYVMSMWTVYPTATPPGPAGRWLAEKLKTSGGKAAS
jgi:DNA-binding transcriptional LysR family regulator